MNFKYLYLIIGLMFISSSIFGAGGCITSVPDRIEGKAPCVNGEPITEPRWCSYVIDPRANPNGLAVIEISSGGRYGADRDRYINIGEGEQYIDVYADRETKPIYIDCYDSRGVPATDASKGWQKDALMQSMTIGIHKSIYHSDINPEDRINSSINTIASQATLANVRFNSLNLAIENLPSDLVYEIDGLEINNNYEDVDDSYPSIAFFIGSLFLVLGLFGMLLVIVSIFRK